MPAIRLSVVIPCYNEERRIGATLRQYQDYLSKQAYAWEIIVIDDGSEDRTAELVRAEYPEVCVVGYTPNRGKGYASRVGLNASQGEIRLVSDADASTPIDEIEKFWPELEKGAEVVIGSRALPASSVEVRQPFYRQNMGRIYNLLLRSLGLTRFPDTQCGFKAFTKHACEVILPRQVTDGFGADAEMLYIAQKHGLRIAQVPVRWINSPDTRVHPIWDSVNMIQEVLQIRANIFRGKYD